MASATDLLLLLFSKQKLYELHRELLHGPFDGVRPETIRSALSRLKSRGLVEKTSTGWRLTDIAKGKIEKFDEFKDFSTSRKYTPSVIVVFDIPEKKRVYRDWLRDQLVNLGYSLVQRSVWFGPPLPGNFIKHLNEIDILQYVRLFKASEQDVKKISIQKSK